MTNSERTGNLASFIFVRGMILGGALGIVAGVGIAIVAAGNPEDRANRGPPQVDTRGDAQRTQGPPQLGPLQKAGLKQRLLLRVRLSHSNPRYTSLSEAPVGAGTGGGTLILR
jgi:hypothetical protein